VITMSLIELEVPLILAINFWEDAEKKGIEINFKKLEEMLGIKVVKINPIKKNGIKELEKNLREAKKSDFNIIYDDDIEYAIQKTMELVERVKLSKRGVAVKILEGDEIAIKKHGVKKDEIVKIERHPIYPEIFRLQNLDMLQ
ncbi:MAG: ferrous iron transport protein B, partial [Thermoplasmata archaeon]|nr:ferrous iron transport protein B [Thermoplasmata archaeon]